MCYYHDYTKPNMCYYHDYTKPTQSELPMLITNVFM